MRPFREYIVGMEASSPPRPVLACSAPWGDRRKQSPVYYSPNFLFFFSPEENRKIGKPVVARGTATSRIRENSLYGSKVSYRREFCHFVILLQVFWILCSRSVNLVARQGNL
jgi:hypothetical protein